MPLRLGFSVGEMFVEASGAGDASPPSPARWYLPRKGLAEGVRDWLGDSAAEGGEIRIATPLPHFALPKKLGATPAFLVTAGFENWISLNAPLAADEKSDTQRTALPLSDDLTFGISERVRADGSVETALSVDELQFLAAKLEMLKTKTVAVGLLHSSRNPAHELRIRDFFGERGYTVFCSHSLPTGTERERWMRAAYDAYSWTALLDLREQFESGLGDNKGKWTIQFVDADSEGTRLSTRAGFTAAFGPAAVLAEHFGRGHPVLHLGLERFLLAERALGELRDRDESVPPYRSIRHRRLGVQPASAIESGFWPAPTLGRAPKTFEPGPMALGKAQHPTVFDLFFALERLEPIEGLSAILQERSRARILEAIFTLSKVIAKVPDPKQIARDLETLVVERINEDLLTLPHGVGEIAVTGALGKTLLTRLQARRPDLKFKLEPEAEWAEALATREFSPRPRPE